MNVNGNRMVTIFRALVLVSTMLALLGYFLPFIDASIYSEEMQSLRAFDGLGASMQSHIALEVSILASLIVFPILLYKFVSWARQAYLLYVLALLVLGISWGMRVITPLELVVWDLVAMMDGAILAIAYFTSVSERFEPNPQVGSR